MSVIVPKADRLAKATLADLQGGQWAVDCAMRVIDRQMSRKFAAIEMREDQGQLTNEANGKGHLSLLRLGMLDQAWWKEFTDEVREHLGLNDDESRLQRAIEHKRLAEAEIERLYRKAVEKR